MKVAVQRVELFQLPLQTRFPFRYGIASMSEAPQVFARVQVQVGDETASGIAADLLPPKWFTKNPETTFEEDDLPQMLRVIRNAADEAMAAGRQPSFFRWWRTLYDQQMSWAESNDLSPLLAGFGASLMERAVLDAVCRAWQTPVHRVLRDGRLEIELGELNPDLKQIRPSDLLPAKPLERLGLRHTVGLGDPLTDGDIPEEDRIDDGLPHSLEANIERYGLRYFKIKLSGDLAADRDRLTRIAALLQHRVGEEARVTVDGNENYRDLETFRGHWRSHVSQPSLNRLLTHSLLAVEQPIHRDVALSEPIAEQLRAWRDAPPIIIDESDATLASTPRALQQGYVGVSHKNCKGVIKGLANAGALRIAAQAGRTTLLTAEDLANYGPIALLQDLAIVAALGIEHVERNGHHYFAGLSSLDQQEQQRVLRGHPDLFAKTDRGFVALAPQDGWLHVESVNDACFGYASPPELEKLQPLPL